MTGFVYAMVSADGRAKIGWSADPVRRLAKINADCVEPVRLAGLVPATVEQEAELLRLLAPWKLHRSWHRMEGAVLAFIDCLPKAMPLARLCKSKGHHPVRRYRQEKELSLEQLADSVGATAASISRIETGLQNPGLDLLRRLVEVTGINPAMLRPDLAEAMRPREAAE